MSEKELNDLIHTGELAKQEIFEKSAEAAAAVDEGSAEEIKAENEKRKRTLIKFGLMTVLAAIILVFASIAWFTMNREVGSSGMGVKTAGMPFELKTSGSAGLYDDYITRADSDYQSGTETGGSTQKLILKLTKGNTESTKTQGNMNNLYSGNGTPTEDEMKEIKKLDSSSYGLSPGDYGTLKFTIVPKVDSVSTTVKFNITCFKTEYYTTGESVGYQKDVFTKMDSEDEDDADAITFATAHIVFFYMDDEDKMHMINEEGFNETDIATDREVTIYWVWPEKLRNILELDINGLDQTGARELRAYMLKHPELFLARNSEDSATVFDSITVANGATENDIQAVANAMTASNTIYNPWGSRYNNADQIIGDEVGYIMPEVSVELLASE